MFSQLLPGIKTSWEFSERKLLLSLADIVLIATGIIGAIWFWAYREERTFEWDFHYHSLWVVVMGLGWLIWMFINDLYDLRIAVKLKQTIQRIALGAVIAAIFYSIYYFITAPVPLSGASFSLRFAPALAIVAISILLSIWRTIYTIFLGEGHATQRTLIFGAGVTGGILAEAFQHNPHYQAIGFIDDDKKLHGKIHQDIRVLGGRQDMLLEVEQNEINEIVLAVSKPIDDDLLQMLSDFHERGVAITPMPVLYEKLMGWRTGCSA